ncbi:MAG: NAD(P)/FAD-dependent oxidoreductase [Hyphomicrobiaceae bacterium]|nr:NAD(P)/FAD-dependent oxidoreductase [Hyphomicrobiaceae bacterium]
MAEIDRRSFNRLLGGAAALGLASGVVQSPAVLAKGKSKGRVVIIGGGAGGASVAHQLRKVSKGIEITLVEPNPIYTSCFFSNHYLGGFRSMRSLQHNYDGLKKLGVKIIHDTALDIDTQNKLVTLKGETRLSYDKLVLSPGIEMKYEAIEGYSPAVAKVMPHAWIAGDQTRLLHRRLLDMKDGGVVVISVPGNPYRCPPAPYERATLIAHYLKYHKPASKLIILDTKSLFPQMALFEEVWASEYKGLLEWIPGDKHGGVNKVIANEMSVVTRNGDRVKGDLINIIPPQRAPSIVARAGCALGDWCPIIPDSFASRQVKDVFVLGDSATARNMPKSASSANSQAQIVANAIAAQLTGRKMFPPRYRSACWSLLAANNAIKAGASYTAGKEVVEQKTSFISDVKEDKGIRAENFKHALNWYDTITSDMFAKG